jgi:hypothetical protein
LEFEELKDLVLKTIKFVSVNIIERCIQSVEKVKGPWEQESWTAEWSKRAKSSPKSQEWRELTKAAIQEIKAAYTNKKAPSSEGAL